MNVMLINNKGFRNDMQTLVDFHRKFLVAIRKFFGEFFIRKFVFKDSGGQTVQIRFAFSFCFRTAVGRYGNLFYGGLRQIFLLKPLNDCIV